MLEKTLESPLDCKKIQPVHPKGNHSWLFIGRTDTEAETPILRLPDEKNWLIGKDLDTRSNWRQEEKGTTAWDGWMASPTRWTWVWVSSGSWWWTGKPGVLQSNGSQRIEHNWVTELNWTELNPCNQIDYILCSQRWRSSIQSPKTRPGADCGSADKELPAMRET